MKQREEEGQSGQITWELQGGIRTSDVILSAKFLGVLRRGICLWTHEESKLKRKPAKDCCSSRWKAVVAWRCGGCREGKTEPILHAQGGAKVHLHLQL